MHSAFCLGFAAALALLAVPWDGKPPNKWGGLLATNGQAIGGAAAIFLTLLICPSPRSSR